MTTCCLGGPPDCCAGCADATPTAKTNTRPHNTVKASRRNPARPRDRGNPDVRLCKRKLDSRWRGYERKKAINSLIIDRHAPWNPADRDRDCRLAAFHVADRDI